MNTHIKKRNKELSSSSYLGALFLLVICALVLTGRLVYFYLSDPERFPITTIKVAASYHHVSHKELETILSQYVSASFFALPVLQLQNELNSMNWIESAYVERVWPDTLKIKLVERVPVASWGDALMTADGVLFNQGAPATDVNVPHLDGPSSQQLEVLQVYEKLSKILSSYSLNAARLQLRDNHSWILSLENGTKVYLGKNNLEARLLRFCKAYPAVFAEKSEQLASVDLRYPRGMAVQWKQQMGR